MGQTQEQPLEQQQFESNDINQGQFGAASAFFPPLNAVVKPQPTIAQAEELAHVTRWLAASSLFIILVEITNSQRLSSSFIQIRLNCNKCPKLLMNNLAKI